MLMRLNNCKLKLSSDLHMLKGGILLSQSLVASTEIVR